MVAGLEFAGPTLAGFVRPTSEFHGVVITRSAAPELVSPTGPAMLNLEHYSCAGRAGMFVPRREALTDWSRGNDSVSLLFRPTRSWRLETRADYRVTDGDTIDVTYTFRFDAAYTAFEAFVASYMPAGTPLPWIPSAGTWARSEVSGRDQLFVARDQHSANAVMDGRWRALTETGYGYKLAPRYYDAACMVSGFDSSAYQWVFMAPPDVCPQLSPNIFAPAHDLSLVGRDVRAGEEVRVPVRLAFRRLETPSEALAEYARFIDEVEGRDAVGTPER